MGRDTTTNGHRPDTRDRVEYFRTYSHDKRKDVKAKLEKWQRRKHSCPACKGELTVGSLDGGKSKMCCPISPADLATARCSRWRTATHYRLDYKG